MLHAGYEPTGNAQRICQNDGRWSELGLSCNYFDCGRVEDDDLLVTYQDNRTTWGARAKWRCGSGAVQVGEGGGAVCGTHGWTQDRPKCIKKSCGDAPQVET